MVKVLSDISMCMKALCFPAQHKASDLEKVCKEIYMSKNSLVIGYRKN